MAAYPGRPDRFQTLAKLFVALVAAGVLVAGLALPYVGGLGLLAGHEADTFQNTACHLPDSKPPQRTNLYARDGKTLIATLFSQDRVPIPLSQVPKYLQEALVATEDRRFYSHHGVDLRGLIRSAVSTSNGDTQGGSTLTMQYVKQIRYFTAVENHDKKAADAATAQNINRKIEDAKCALYIEGTLHESKDTILQNYLNIAFFGENAYGIQTAARTYFDKPASKLTLDESATLVGLLRAPSSYDPYVDRAAATARRNEVLQNLVSVGQLSQANANRQKAQPIALSANPLNQVKQGCPNASSKVENAAFFCQYAVDWLEKNNKLTNTELNTGGLKIVTTLDPALQESAQSRLDKAIPAKSSDTAVLPAVDPKTGDVLAMATSKTFGLKAGQTEQPVFTKAVAQGASTFKLFPLLTALSTGVPEDWPLYTPDNSYKPKFCATRHTVSNGDAQESYNSQETLESATAKSSNTYFVALADQLLGCQLTPIVDVAKQLGVTGFDSASDVSGQNVGQAIESNGRAQALVLGSIPVSPLQLAGAYAAVANGGKYNAPAPILSITDSSGNAIPVRRSSGTQVVNPQAAQRAVHILSGDTTGDGTSASRFDEWYASGGSDVAGKTGTNAQVTNGKETSKNAAVWFVGMTPDLVAASALINFDYPTHASKGLPGEATGAAYGDYASKVWLSAFGPSLLKKSWDWPSGDDVAGTDVPDLDGLSISDARKKLADDDFTLTTLDQGNVQLRCPSSEASDSVAFYGPHKAEPGSTITVCRSLGVPQTVAPVIVQRPASNNHGSGNRGNGGNGRGTGGNGGSGNAGSGNGGSGNGGSGNGGSGNGGSGNGGSGNGGSGNGGSGNGGSGNGGSGNGGSGNGGSGNGGSGNGGSGNGGSGNGGNGG